MGWCSKRTLPSDRHIVIVGAGYGGCKLAEELDTYEGANYTIINPRPEFHHCIASCRAAVIPDFSKKMLIPLPAAFGDHYVQGSVVDIQVEDKVVVLDNGKRIQYDVLVLCTGTGGAFPIKLDPKQSTSDVMKEYEKLAKQIEQSGRIVVIGGGATGVEMASEIASYHKLAGTPAAGAGDGKTVTLVTAQGLIPEFSRDKARDKTLAILTQKGVNVITGERVSNYNEVLASGAGPVLTDKGSRVEADLVINCMGLRINTQAYSNTALASQMDERGRLKVNQYLQVEVGEHTEIFALGDCCNTAEGKLGYVAQLQAIWLAGQMNNYMHNKQMSPYNVGGSPVELVVAMGPDAGVGLIRGGWMMPSWIVALVKSGSLLIPKFWKEMYQKMPE